MLTSSSSITFQIKSQKGHFSFFIIFELKEETNRFGSSIRQSKNKNMVIASWCFQKKEGGGAFPPPFETALKVYPYLTPIVNAIWKLVGGGTFYFVVLEGRPLLWSQNAAETCLTHLQGCIKSFNSSNIFEKKLWAKIYKIKRNFKNRQKRRRAGTLNMFFFFFFFFYSA